MAQQGHGGRKAREGTVVSDRMDKTVVVAVGSSMRSRIYKKIVRRVRRFMAHDETNDAKLGDRVLIVESRPYSRRKRWQLSQVLVRADRPEIAAEEIDLELLGEVKAEEEGEAAATVEAGAEEVAPADEGEETPEPSEAAAEAVPPVEEAVPGAAEPAEAAADEPEAKAEAETEEAVEAAAGEPEAAADAEEVEEAAHEEPDAEAKVEDAPESAGKEAEAEADGEEAVEAAEAPETAAEEPEGEDPERSS